MIISPFNPLFFLRDNKRTGDSSPFTQIFSSTDSIFLQVIRTALEEPFICEVYNAVNGSKVRTIECSQHTVNQTDCVDCYTITGLECGEYILCLNDNESEPFIITDDKFILDKTVLIQYSPAEISIRKDVAGVIDGKRIFFSFRAAGGFKDDGWSFSVENEQFTTDMADIMELYGMESTQKTLTIGFSHGVPIWYGQLLNRLLTCRYVYIDNIRFARFESSVPEKEQTIQGVNSFVFTQKLQEIRYNEPKLEII